MEVLIFGAGAVGLGLGSFLLQSGEGVRFVAREATSATLRREGLERTGIFGTHWTAPERFAAASRIEDLPAEPVDFVLVTTKTFDSSAAARSLAARGHRLGVGARIVLCQNGWGSAESFATRFSPERIWHARVITGFRRRAPARVELTVHAAPIRIGSLHGAEPREIAPLCEALSRSGLPTEPTERIAEELWAKLLYNGCLNALGAIFGVPYGALGASEHGRRLLRELADEIFAVMHAAGYRTHWSSPEAFLRALHGELLPATASHEPSTLQDLRGGGRTEIDALNGAVVALGEELDLPVPVNRCVCEMIRFLEKQPLPAR